MPMQNPGRSDLFCPRVEYVDSETYPLLLLGSRANGSALVIKYYTGHQFERQTGDWHSSLSQALSTAQEDCWGQEFPEITDSVLEQNMSNPYIADQLE